MYFIKKLRTYVPKAPTIQPLSSRNLRKSPLHNFHEKNGVFFGVTGGWERPMFYIPELKSDLKVPAEYDWYGYYEHPKRTEVAMYENIHDNEYANWSFSKRVSALIGKEVDHCRNECSIFDLTSFGKVRIKMKMRKDINLFITKKFLKHIKFIRFASKEKML